MPSFASFVGRLAVPCLLLAAALPAQYSRARSDFDKVRSAQGNLALDRDRADQLSRARQLNEACGALMDSLREVGRELGEFGNTFGDERNRPRRAAATVRGQAEVLRGALDAWMRKLDSQDNHKTEGERVLAQADELVKQWTELTRRVEETRRWCADGLKEAARERDRVTQGAKPIADAQNAAWARLQNAQRADDRADSDHDRALERVVAAEARENETCNQYIEAWSRGARSEEVWASRQRWSRAVDEQNDALVAAYNALQAQRSARDELGNAYQQLAQTQREMRQFANATNPDKIIENYNYFVRWCELCEREFQ